MTSAEPGRSARPCRTLLVVSMSTHVGGAERSLLSLLPHLPAQGWDPVLACPDGALAREAAARAVPVRTVPWRAIAPIRSLEGRYGIRAVAAAVWASCVNARRLVLMIHTERPRVVLSNSSNAHLLVAAAGRVARRPVVWHLRDIVRPGPGRWVLRRAARGVAGVIAISQSVAETVQDAPTVVVGNPVEMPGWAGSRDQDRRPTVGFVGRLDPEKGLEVLIQAMRVVAAPLAIFGERGVGPVAHVERLRALAGQEGLDATWHGHVARPEDAFAQIDVLAVPSVLEPWGRVAAEALTCGIPVVASNAGGLVEIVRHGVDGLLVPPGDVAAWSSALRRLVTDHALRARMADAALQGKHRFSATVHAESVAQVLTNAQGREAR